MPTTKGLSPGRMAFCRTGSGAAASPFRSDVTLVAMPAARRKFLAAEPGPGPGSVAVATDSGTTLPPDLARWGRLSVVPLRLLAKRLTTAKPQPEPFAAPYRAAAAAGPAVGGERIVIGIELGDPEQIGIVGAEGPPLLFGREPSYYRGDRSHGATQFPVGDPEFLPPPLQVVHTLANLAAQRGRRVGKTGRMGLNEIAEWLSDRRRLHACDAHVIAGELDRRHWPPGFRRRSSDEADLLVDARPGKSLCRPRVEAGRSELGVHPHDIRERARQAEHPRTAAADQYGRSRVLDAAGRGFEAVEPVETAAEGHWHSAGKHGDYLQRLC